MTLDERGRIWLYPLDWLIGACKIVIQTQILNRRFKQHFWYLPSRRCLLFPRPPLSTTVSCKDGSNDPGFSWNLPARSSPYTGQGTVRLTAVLQCYKQLRLRYSLRNSQSF